MFTMGLLYSVIGIELGSGSIKPFHNDEVDPSCVDIVWIQSRFLLLQIHLF